MLEYQESVMAGKSKPNNPGASQSTSSENTEGTEPLHALARLLFLLCVQVCDTHYLTLLR